MRLLDLFAGIGGFSLAAHWMNWQTVAFVERDKFCQKVLRKNFGQDIEIHDDICTFSGKPFRGAVDIITGGFPCQPYSFAGKRKGTADARHLWPEMLRTIREVQPRYVVGENVFGLVGWSGGLVFEQVQADLEAAGYKTWAGVLPACGVGAPHRRNRVWFIAHADRDGESIKSGNGHSGCRQLGRTLTNPFDDGDLREPRTNASTGGQERLQERHAIQRPIESISVREVDTDGGINLLQRSQNFGGVRSGRPVQNEQPVRLLRATWEKFPTQSPVCGRDDGIPDRVDRIKSLGNSIVPQVAYEIFRAIEAVESDT